MTEQKDGNSTFRSIVGFIALAASICGFAALFIVEVPPANRDALMFALGGVFGWGSAVVQSEYGATTTGRRVAESAVRQIERQTVANELSPVPADAQEAANQVADAATEEAEHIGRRP